METRGMWGALPLLAVTEKPMTPAERRAYAKARIAEIRAEARVLRTEIKSISASNKTLREETRDERDEAAIAAAEKTRAKTRMRLAAEKLRADKLAAAKQKAADLAAEVLRRNGGREYRTIAQDRLAQAHLRPTLADRWQPRAETRYIG